MAIICSGSTIRLAAKSHRDARDNFVTVHEFILSRSRTLYDRGARKISRLINRLPRFMHTVVAFIRRRCNNTSCWWLKFEILPRYLEKLNSTRFVRVV